MWWGEGGAERSGVDLRQTMRKVAKGREGIVFVHLWGEMVERFFSTVGAIEVGLLVQ